MVGFQVVMVDERPQFNQERFPEAEEVITEEIPFTFPKLKVKGSFCLAIVTRGYAYDHAVLKWLWVSGSRAYPS
jgi:hypothetical protein